MIRTRARMTQLGQCARYGPGLECARGGWRVLAKIRSAAVQGLEAYPIDVEVDVGGGLPAFAIVGLPDTAVQEAKERVRAAIRNSNYDVPSRKITVNLAPADVRKEGPAFDLPMAVGILAATEQIRTLHLDGTVLLGELSLDGGVRPVAGLLSIALAARGMGMRAMIVPRDNAAEAALVDGLDIFPVTSLGEVVRHLEGGACVPALRAVPEDGGAPEFDVDFSEVRGQDHARRAIEIAAAGGHNVLMVGTFPCESSPARVSLGVCESGAPVATPSGTGVAPDCRTNPSISTSPLARTVTALTNPRTTKAFSSSSNPARRRPNRDSRASTVALSSSVASSEERRASSERAWSSRAAWRCLISSTPR